MVSVPEPQAEEVGGNRVREFRPLDPGPVALRPVLERLRLGLALPDVADLTDGLRLDSEDIDVLKACCSKRPPRNAAAIVSAIKARLEYSQPKPKQQLEHSGSVKYELIDPFARASEASGG